MIELRRRPSALLLLLLGSITVSGVARGGAEEEPSGAGATIRLAERLDEARIRSPLLELEPAADLVALDDPVLDLMLEEDFELFDWEFSGWFPSSVADVVQEGENHVFRLTGGSDSFFGWVLPVRTDAFYRFTRSVRVLGAPFCDLYAVESRAEPDAVLVDPGAHFLAGRGSALKVHGLPLDAGTDDGGSGEWQRASTSFYPTPRTRSLVVLVRPRVGSEGLVESTSFDDVRLEEVVPSKEERMRLLLGAHAAPGADPARNMQKAGWLLPLPSPEGVQEGEPAESNYNWRRALYAPPTTELAFDLVVPAGGRLRLGTGLARETPPGAAARFQVEVAGSGAAEPERLLDSVRAARMEEWHWEDQDLDLSPWSGQEVTLILRTLAEEGDPHSLWAAPRVEPATSGTDPLVILIAVDTLRADRLSTYGYEAPTSPALDRLAEDGVRFDQARSNCNWTCPSFASIFTGLVPSRHGVSSYGPATPLPDELVTLAEHFQTRGWATRSIAYKVPLFDGNYEQGFDEAFNVPRDVIRGEENLARALEWLKTHRGGPAFLFLHFNDPHQPFVHPEPLDRAFGHAAEGASGVPAGDQGEQERFSGLYDGAIAYVDSCIGRFLDALRERGFYDRATIAFVADHGEQFWEHGRFGHGGDDLYDEIVRVPLIVKPPAETFEAGRVVQANVSAFDVMPTLLELGGIAPPEGLDARSLVGLIDGSRESLGRVVVTETSLRGLALVDGGFKYVLQSGGREALYDLRGDPHERKDVAGERTDELARLRALAVAYLLEHRPGNYLLLRTGAEPASLGVPAHGLRTLVGPIPSGAASGSPPRTVLRMEANAWALVAVEGAEAVDLAVEGLPRRKLSSDSDADFEPWIAGTLPSLSGAGVWRVRGPLPPARAAAPEATVDAEVIEALRRLGYVGD